MDDPLQAPKLREPEATHIVVWHYPSLVRLPTLQIWWQICHQTHQAHTSPIYKNGGTIFFEFCDLLNPPHWPQKFENPHHGVKNQNCHRPIEWPIKTSEREAQRSAKITSKICAEFSEIFAETYAMPKIPHFFAQIFAEKYCKYLRKHLRSAK